MRLRTAQIAALNAIRFSAPELDVTTVNAGKDGAALRVATTDGRRAWLITIDGYTTREETNA